MKFTLAAGLLSVLFVGISPAAKSADSIGQSAEVVDIEMKNREIAFQLAPIKSQDDLQRYMSATPERSNPISKLSVAGKQRFLDSLVFNERGLAGLRYSDLEAELTVSQIYKIMSLFGAQHTTGLMMGAKVRDRVDSELRSSPSLRMAEDQKGKRCAAEGRCETSSNDICMSGC